MRQTTTFNRFINRVHRFFNHPDDGRTAIVLAAVTFLGIWAILASAYWPSSFDLAPGSVAGDTIVAPRAITFENEAATERTRVASADAVPRVYDFDATIMPRVVKNLNSWFDAFSAMEAQEKAQAQAAGQPYDPARVAQQAAALPNFPKIPESTLTMMAGMAADRVVAMRAAVVESLSRVMEANVSEATIATDRERLGSVLETLSLRSDEMMVGEAISGSFLEPNNIYNNEKTQEARARAASDVQPVMVTIQSGQTIVSPGQIVNDEDVAALKALGLTEQGRKYGAIVGLALLALVEVLILVFYIRRFERKVKPSRSLQFVTATLILFFCLMARVAASEPLSPLLVPMAALGMLGTFLLGTRLAVIMVMISSANLAVVSGSDPQYVVVALFGGLAGAFLVTNVSQRRELVWAGLITGVVVIATAVASGQLTQSSFSRAGAAIAWGAGNAVLAVGVTGALLTFYEMLLNLPTPLKLLELADPTRPLLKELMMRAPGTYNHSIIMGNIAETAAEAIGANPLLARVGAYYHDIGKLNRPDYFIENQFHVKNPHDRLTPGLSRLAITAHVKDGVQLANDEGLPQEIIDIIREHHGTTILAYFYHKAKELQEVREGRIDEETYRYAGHKPTSREAAIVMLADSVEAAVHSLKNPTMRNIKNVIRDIFDQRLRDGQLSESRMTFTDLERIREVFEKSLRGFGATRVAYPAEMESKRRSAKPGGVSGRTGTGA